MILFIAMKKLSKVRLNVTMEKMEKLIKLADSTTKYIDKQLKSDFWRTKRTSLST